MFYLTAQHLDEISETPKLVALTDGSIVPECNMKEFVQLCVEHRCVQTFMWVGKDGPLNVLARHNGVELAQHFDFSQEHPKAWKRAARHAGFEGHAEFAQYILTHCNTDEIRKSVITGACMGDQDNLLKRFAPTIEDPGFASHLPPLAAQLNAVECMRYLVKGISPKTWMSTMAVASLTDAPHLIDILMDHTPVGLNPPKFWCEKVAIRVVGNPSDQRVLNVIFQHTTDQEIIASAPRMPMEKQDRLTSVYQHSMLTNHTSGSTAFSYKRKI